MHEIIPQEAFDRILQQAIIRPAGRQFRGEPARQVEILRCLRESARPVPFDELHDHLRHKGVLRSERDDDASRRKAIGQAVEAINTKLGAFFFLARDVRLIEEMFRIQVHSEETTRPSYSLQDFFEVRKISGVRFYATTDEPSGGITRELYELITEVRPRVLDMMAPSFESFFGNPEFRGMLARNLDHDEARVRVLLLNPDSAAAGRLESQESHEPRVPRALRDRIRATLMHAASIHAALPETARSRLSVRLSDGAPLWRFRMIFLPEVLHLRLSAPRAPGQTLIKLGRASALYTSLHDVFEQQWEGAAGS
ncbi:MAG TPA: hypothetical protein VGK94_00655 [Candidatus Polarisedimenticolia bacterium]|jgi:hypothetical protein